MLAFATLAVDGCRVGAANKALTGGQIKIDQVLENTGREYQLTLDSFRSHTYRKIRSNRAEIESYRAAARGSKQIQALEELADEIDLLDQQNDALLERLTNFQIHGSLEWKEFQEQLAIELRRLEIAIQSFAVHKPK
jgi:hypothetical protein